MTIRRGLVGEFASGDGKQLPEGDEAARIRENVCFPCHALTISGRLRCRILHYRASNSELCGIYSLPLAVAPLLFIVGCLELATPLLLRMM